MENTNTAPRLPRKRRSLAQELVTVLSEQIRDGQLSGSAIGWYGAQGDTALDETSAPHDEFQHRLCADWEDAARAAQDRVPVVLLRTGVVLHPAGGMLQRLRTPFQFGLGARLGDGRQVLSWIAREDWIDAAVSLLRAHLDGEADAPTGAFNLTAPERITRELLDQGVVNDTGSIVGVGASQKISAVRWGVAVRYWYWLPFYLAGITAVAPIKR